MTVDYTFKISSIGSILSKNFQLFEYFKRKSSKTCGKRMATTTNAGHRSIQKSMAEARFARIQPQITIFASPIHYECMRIEIRELLRTVMTTTSNEGFFMNKMSFVHLFEMVMIFYFHSRGILNKSRNGGWIIHLEKEMIFISIIELTIRVKITKNLR